MAISSHEYDNTKCIPILDGMRYFYSKTEDCNFVPRLEITMTTPIVLPFLQKAAEKAMARYRVFRLAVKSNTHEYYLVDNNSPPIVHVDDGTRHIVGTEENNGHLTWIGARDRTIIVEFFHGVSDGHGIIPFFKLLLQCYCNLCHGKDCVPDPSAELLPEDPIECMDSMFFIDEHIKTRPQKMPPIAFQLPDERIAPESATSVYSLTVDAAQFDAYMRKNRSSRNAVFALFMNHAIANIRTNRDARITAGIAGDVRKIYGAEKTMRDCSDFLDVWFDKEIETMPIDKQLQISRQMIIDAMQPDLRLAFAAESKRNNMQLIKRLPMLEDKKRFCQRVLQHSYLRHTYTLSYVGQVSFGEEIDAYIERISWTMGSNAFPIMIKILQHNQKYHISYCTRLKNDSYVQEFQKMFLQAGIPCTCERRSNYSETLAVF